MEWVALLTAAISFVAAFFALWRDSQRQRELISIESRLAGIQRQLTNHNAELQRLATAAVGVSNHFTTSDDRAARRAVQQLRSRLAEIRSEAEAIKRGTLNVNPYVDKDDQRGRGSQTWNIVERAPAIISPELESVVLGLDFKNRSLDRETILSRIDVALSSLDQLEARYTDA